MTSLSQKEDCDTGAGRAGSVALSIMCAGRGSRMGVARGIWLPDNRRSAGLNVRLLVDPEGLGSNPLGHGAVETGPDFGARDGVWI
ncbi:hypothetical protein BaRGS_00026734 [Batillaria attramentaria]|uniref:MobA-like NTP transferase domain-containing protein n=1 Tax=Batillaria attramentaria TaxID=370345 RepID=A0ABD0K5E2_9CAEN